VPSSIQSLIERRLAQLPEECRALLADAGVLGRRFGLGDLAKVLARVKGEPPTPEWQLGEVLQKAVDLGLLLEEPAGSRYEFSFSHDQIRAALLSSISRQRKRAIHGAIAESLAADGGSHNLSMLAHHALQAGDQTMAVSAALEAARAAMSVSAPEEAVRLIDAALPAASKPEDRIQMLSLKDDALQILERGIERLANLAEMTALAAALPASGLDSEVKLRRASAARANQDFDQAVELALGVCQVAMAAKDARLELAARLELGQALTRAPIGEGYMTLVEVDLDAAEAAFQTALRIAREIGARSEEADALRELAVIEAGRVKHAAIAAEEGGTSRIEILMQAPTMFGKTKELAEEAFRIYEEIKDKRGSMSALILMAYAHVTDPTATGMAGRMEHIRALHHNKSGEVTESQRAKDDALMLYSIHTYARINLQPGLALERGREAFDAARALGDRWLECLVAGGMAMTHLSIGDEVQCGAWLERAATAAVSVASSSMARRLEMWRGSHAAARNDLNAMVSHFERAAEMAGLKNLGGRCQALSTLAFESARIGVTTGDETALKKAKLAAGEALATVRSMSGRLPWEAEAHASLALVAQAEGDQATAATEARACLDLDGETFIEQYVHSLWAAGRILIVNSEPEAASLSAEIIAALGFVDMSMSDPEIKARWTALPHIRELAEIVGFEWTSPPEDEGVELGADELGLLREMAAGSLPNQESDPEAVEVLLAKLGAASRAEALEYAIKAGVTWQ
jgi:tetratricopeptide (TPR) repeat protein